MGCSVNSPLVSSCEKRHSTCKLDCAPRVSSASSCSSSLAGGLLLRVLRIVGVRMNGGSERAEVTLRLDTSWKRVLLTLRY